MNTQKARVAVEDMAMHYRTLTEAKEDCKQQVAARMELLVAESTDKVKADAEELATLMNEIGL